MKKIEVETFPCTGRRGNTWYQFTYRPDKNDSTLKTTIGVSLDGAGEMAGSKGHGPDDGPLVAELPLHGEVDVDDEQTTLSIVDAAGVVLRQAAAS